MTDDTPMPVDAPADAPAAVTVYWRPGCPFCMTLRAGLRRAEVPYREVNIWEDAEAAAFVRSVANGNETVPTVTVGDVAMVNPSAGTVQRVAIDAGVMAAPEKRRWFG